ncbi:PfkB family carbohydrate kinase [Paenibacillus silviterrae]|uniref:PfkB family carbohydrate kinase n=1 Tax=Paenibacillus silviterrae TaxID=3242194 RepID=UPI0025428DBB|nr:PfkB family carbohydrate kinase [Paenibacillus chinjuensis]
MSESRKKRIVCLGELLIDFVPETNGQPLSDVPAFRKAAGGAPANVAAAVAKLGGSARFIGKTGRDAFGQFLRGTLEDAGVDARLVETDAARTGLAFVSLREDGERDFLFYREPAADMLLEAQEVDAAWLEDAAVYHFGSVSLIAEPCRSATLEAARRVREAGGLVSYDPNLRPMLWPDADRMRREVLAHIGLGDVVKVGEEELTFLAEESDAAAAEQRLLALGARVLVVTLGGEGCRVVTSGGARIRVPGFPVHAVDTTGAGDSFVGAMLHRLVELGVTAESMVSRLGDEATVHDVFRFANKVGALTTTRRGAIPALPTLAEAEAFHPGG